MGNIVLLVVDTQNGITDERLYAFEARVGEELFTGIDKALVEAFFRFALGCYFGRLIIVFQERFPCADSVFFASRPMRACAT